MSDAALADPFAHASAAADQDPDDGGVEIGRTTVIDDGEYDPDREPVKLADAAADALDGYGGESEQAALIPACRVRFVGMSWDSLDDVPSLKQEMSFQVQGRVVGHGQQVMKDGEIRETATVEVTKVIQIDV